MNETAAPPRRLRRSTTDCRIAGVAGGMGAYLGIDPVLIRIAFVVATLAGGAGLVAYIAGWILMPEDDGTVPTTGSPVLSPAGGRVVGVIVLVAALVLAVDGFGHSDGILWPLLLVAGGVLLLARPGILQEMAEHFDDATTRTSTETGSGEPTPAPEGGSVSTEAPGVGSVPPPPAPPAPPHRPPSSPPPPPRGTRVDRFTLALVLLAAGGLGILAAVGVDVSIRTALLAALAVTAGGLLVGAFVGRARGLVWLAVPIVLALSATSALDLHLDGGFGERHHRPTSVAELRDQYDLGVGELIVDLDGLPETTWRNQRREITVQIGIGDVLVNTPDDVSVEVHAEVDAGEAVVFGRSYDGTGIDVDEVRRGTEGAGTIVLVVDAGLGQLTVR